MADQMATSDVLQVAWMMENGKEHEDQTVGPQYKNESVDFSNAHEVPQNPFTAQGDHDTANYHNAPVTQFEKSGGQMFVNRGSAGDAQNAMRLLDHATHPLNNLEHDEFLLSPMLSSAQSFGAAEQQNHANPNFGDYKNPSLGGEQQQKFAMSPNPVVDKLRATLVARMNNQQQKQTQVNADFQAAQHQIANNAFEFHASRESVAQSRSDYDGSLPAQEKFEQGDSPPKAASSTSTSSVVGNNPRGREQAAAEDGWRQRGGEKCDGGGEGGGRIGGEWPTNGVGISGRGGGGGGEQCTPSQSQSSQPQQPILPSQQQSHGGDITLDELLQQPQPSVPRHSSLPANTAASTPSPYGSHPASMQFYTNMQQQQPPPHFAQTYNMRVEDEQRQIMNLDQQQQHQPNMHASPSSSYANPHLYPPMSTGSPMYDMSQRHQSPMYPMSHQPYFGVPPQHMVHQQQPMMSMQQPYFTAQSPLAGHGVPPTHPHHQMTSTATTTPPVVNFDAIRPNGNGQIFNFTKKGRQRKSHDVGSVNSPTRFGADDDDLSRASLPDMSDFTPLDVAHSKPKSSGRKQCRPHLCEQSRMLIARVGNFNREFARRLNPRHPLHSSAVGKPDQWTSMQLGVSLATVRKCLDMTSESESFMRCSDKNLVNLSPTEKEEREKRIEQLADAFEDEKLLGSRSLNTPTSTGGSDYSQSVAKSSASPPTAEGSQMGGDNIPYEVHAAQSSNFALGDGATVAELPIVTINSTELDFYPKVELDEEKEPSPSSPKFDTAGVQGSEEKKRDKEKAKGRRMSKTPAKDAIMRDENEREAKKDDDASEGSSEPRDSATPGSFSSRSGTATPTSGEKRETRSKAKGGRRRANIGDDNDFEVKRRRGEGDDADSHKMVTRSTRGRTSN